MTTITNSTPFMNFSSTLKSDSKDEDHKAKEDLTRHLVAQAFSRLLAPSDEKAGFMGAGSASQHFMDFLTQGIVDASPFSVGKKIASTLLSPTTLTEVFSSQGEET